MSFLVSRRFKDSFMSKREKIPKAVAGYQIIRMLASGDKIEELLEEYPSLKIEDVYACLDYAAALAEEQITPIEMIEST